MIFMVISRGTGRPDYSSEVVKIAAPTFGSTTGTVSVPGQSPYFATATLNVPQNTITSFVIGAGFDSSSSFVPSGTQLILDKVEISGARNTLCQLTLQYDDGTTKTSLGQKTGYQNASIEIGRARHFAAGSRPYYQITNWDTASSVTFKVNTFGFIENVKNI